MSLGDAKVPEEKAQKAAERTLRLNIGNLPHLGDAERTDGEYSFPVLVSIPQVIFDETPEGLEPVDVKFMSNSEVGEITVDAGTGEVSEYTSPGDIESAIEQEKRELERAVQRALIQSTAKKLALLSYPQHRQMPLMEVLSEIILNGHVEANRVNRIKKDYSTHTENLKEVGLITEVDGVFEADDELKQIISNYGSPSDRLQAALTHLFENKSKDLEMMNEFLGPYLEIAGYYYTRAVASESLPKVTLEEFRREISSRHAGKEGEKKNFQTARWLIQLEEIGVLKVANEHGDRCWKGDESVMDDLLSKQDELGQFGVVA